MCNDPFFPPFIPGGNVPVPIRFFFLQQNRDAPRKIAPVIAPASLGGRVRNSDATILRNDANNSSKNRKWIRKSPPRRLEPRIGTCHRDCAVFAVLFGSRPQPRQVVLWSLALSKNFWVLLVGLLLPVTVVLLLPGGVAFCYKQKEEPIDAAVISSRPNRVDPVPPKWLNSGWWTQSAI